MHPQLTTCLRASVRSSKPHATLNAGRQRVKIPSCSRRCYSNQQHHSESPQPKRRSAYAQWYADVVPGMIPVALLGSAVYLGLHLTQVYLSNEKFLDEANARITALEQEIDELRAERDKRKEGSSSSKLTGPPIVDKRPSRWWFTST